MHGTRTKTLATNCLFGVFFLALLGWGMLHAWAMTAGAGVAAHATIAVPGLAMSGLVLYRHGRHWPVPQRRWNDARVNVRSVMPYVLQYVLLAAGGDGVALLVDSGSLLLAAAAALALVLLPWTRIPVCRDHFFVSAAVMGAATAIGLASSDKPVHPLHYPLCACVFLSLACSMLMFVMAAHGDRADRMPAPRH